MAIPTTRAALQTRALALRVEAAELAQGAYILQDGTDAGTADQRRHCAGLASRLVRWTRSSKPRASLT